ncbi:MAG: protein kinase domain-containing protein, partial [Planctomycetota bacterium]
MADCPTHAEIERFLADALSPDEKVWAEAHIAKCEQCRKEVERRRADHELLGKIKHAYQAETVSRRDEPTHSQAPPRPPTESIEGFEILSEVHRGGQGVVYKAVQKATKRTVALKVLLQGPYASPCQRHRFEREIDLVASLQHPNIVTVYDSGVTGDGRHFFAMEYIHGLPLDAHLSDKNLSIDETLRLFQMICAAVNYAHQRGVIHRDLKPSNIRIDANGKAHILDFGLAKAAGPDLSGGAPVTVTGEFMGTLAYASPEQTKGDPNLIDIRTDVYSLGVILYEMLTGKYPYQVVGQMADVLKNIAEAEPKKPSTVRRQINDEVETIILKSLAKERDRRYQSAETLARDIAHYLAGEPIDAKRDSTWYVIRKSLRLYRAVVAPAAAFVLVLTQRKLAEAAEQEQSRARQEAEKTRDQLRIVTEFQSSMLGDIDAELMGIRLKQDLGERLRESLEKKGLDNEQVQSALVPFEESLLSINATDAALKIIDKNVLARAVETIEKDFADQALVRAALQQTVADTYDEIGLCEPALALQEAALATRRRVLGEEHPITLKSVGGMGLMLKSMGKLDEAEPYYREALDARRRVLGDEHQDTLKSVSGMGSLLQSMGKLDEAESYY